MNKVPGIYKLKGGGVDPVLKHVWTSNDELHFFFILFSKSKGSIFEKKVKLSVDLNIKHHFVTIYVTHDTSITSSLLNNKFIF